MNATEEQFWQRVEKRPSGCWEWTGPVRGKGYGGFYYNGQSHYAHRWSYEQNVGEIGRGLSVLHRCDNPPCVNPAHLFLGDHVANAADREAKGRGGDRRCVGTANGRALLNESKVRALRARVAGGEQYPAIAADLGVGPHVVAMAARGETWRHVR